MSAHFDADGIHFRYPENWRLEREDTESGWTVMLQSPETAFFLLSLDESGIGTDQTSGTALDALKEEYPDLEFEERTEALAGQPAIGHDIRFTSLDLTNTCWTRSFYCSEGTVFVLCQLNDLELETHEPVLRAICASLKIDD